MNLTCIDCGCEFDSNIAVGYCDGCRDRFGRIAEKVARIQNPGGGIMLDGKFTDDPGPRSFHDPISNKNLCGLCGSNQLEMGYGLGSGRGMGSYNFCCGCGTMLDFSEDRGDE